MAYPIDAILGPVSVFKVPVANTDGTTPQEGDVLYRDTNGNPQWGSSAVVARSLVQLANLAAIQAQATISRTKVYVAADTGKQYMWTGEGAAGNWTVAEVNAGLALGETSATAYRGDRGKTAYDHSQAIATAAEFVAGTDKTKNATVGFLKDATALDGFWLTSRTKMPDGATAVYVNDDWTSLTGWAWNSVSHAENLGIITITPSGGTTNSAIITLAVSAKTLFIKVKRLTNSPNVFRVGALSSGYGTLKNFDSVLSMTDSVIICQLPVNTAIVAIYPDATSGSVAIAVDTIWIGDYFYLPGSLSEEAARIADQLGDTAGVGVAASGTITATDQPTATKGDTIGGKKYTYVSALTASPGVEGEVLIGSDKEDTLENLDLAITEADRASNGTKYWAAAVHPLVSSAHTVGAASITLTAKNPGLLGNQITVSCESGTNHTASGSTLSGGKDAVGDKIHTQMQTMPATTAKYGAALLAADGNTDAGKAVQGNDARLISAPTNWTPVPRFDGVNDDGTFSIDYAKYVKSGKKIAGDVVLSWTAKGTKTGEFSIAGLPFAGLSALGIIIGTVRPQDGMAGLTVDGCISAIIGSSTTITFRKQGATNMAPALSDANFTSSSKIIIHFEYLTP